MKKYDEWRDDRTPDHFLTGVQTRTPRGSFSVVDMSREEMEIAGYTYHHRSDNDKYLIMSNGWRSYAILNEEREIKNEPAPRRGRSL